MPSPDAAPIRTSIDPETGPLAEEHIERAFRIMLAGADEGPGCIRVITGAPHPFGNMALFSRDGSPDAVAAGVEPLCACPDPSAAVFIGPVAQPVAEALARAGFEPHGDMPAMAVEIESLQPVALPDGFTFERVGPGRAADEWVEAFAAGYELPLAVAALFRPHHLGDTSDPKAPFQYFCLRRNGTIVSTSILFLQCGVAGIYGVSTVPHERGKGLGAFATAEPLRLAHSLGYRIGVLQASPAGHPVYERLGFRVVGTVPLFIRTPG